VLVLTNVGDDAKVECGFHGNAMAVTLERNSVLTLKWS